MDTHAAMSQKDRPTWDEGDDVPRNVKGDRAARWRAIFFVVLLILGQIALAHHLIVHKLDQVQRHEEAACGLCVMGGHMALAVEPPAPMPPFVYDKITYFYPAIERARSLALETLRSRGPPAFPTA